jgi:hypothetical protein
VPLNSVSSYILDLLDGLPLPGPAGASGNLACYVTPPDPGTLEAPSAYLWPSTGSETRLTSPRAGAPNVAEPGWKKIAHRLELWLTWLGAGDDPSADTNFPAVVDAVMAALRPSPDPVVVTDPVTGVITSITIDVGEHMTYDVAVVHSLEDQRYLRYDARLTLPVTEIFQA